MKIFIKSILTPFLLTALITFIVNEDITVIPDLIKDILTNYAEKKSMAKGYTIWVFILLLIAAASEIFLMIGITWGFFKQGFDKALQKVLTVGCALLGAIAGLIISLWYHDDNAEIYQGVILFFVALLFVISQVFLAFSFRYLNAKHQNISHQKIMKIVTFFCVVACA